MSQATPIPQSAKPAAAAGGIDIVRLLLSKGADPTIRNWDGWTILQIARERKNQAIIDLLAAAEGAK